MTDTYAERPLLPAAVVEAIRARRPFEDGGLIGYITRGETYIVASSGWWTDSNKPRDLIAVLPGDLGSGRVLSLYIGANPDTIAFLERELAAART